MPDTALDALVEGASGLNLLSVNLEAVVSERQIDPACSGATSFAAAFISFENVIPGASDVVA